MPLNIADIEDVFLTGKAAWEGFIEGAIQEFYEPAAKRVIGAIWSQMDMPSRDILQQRSPDTYEWLIKQFGEPEEEETDYAIENT